MTLDTSYAELAEQRGSWAAAADFVNRLTSDNWAARVARWETAGRQGHPADPQYDAGFEQALAAQDAADAKGVGR